MFLDQPISLIQPFGCALFILLFIQPGCSQNNDQREFERAAFSEPNGITVTNNQGGVETADPDDWRIAPFFQGGIYVMPPFPNPVQSNDAITLEINVWFLDRITGIYLRVYDPPNIYPVDERTQITTGSTTFRIDPLLIATSNRTNPAGLYRLIIQDENENVITYGDIEIQ